MERLRQVLIILLALFILVSSVNSLLKLISDPDFFWHLATGRWIVENRSLPSSDPFSYTTPALLSSREHFILTQYWLSQVLFYGIYVVGGYNGIILFNMLITALLLVFLARLGRTADRTIFLSVLFLSLVVILRSYPLERPQVFSFLFFAVLLSLLSGEIMRRQELPERDQPGTGALEGGPSAPGNHARVHPHGTAFSPRALLIPLLMLLWANMHGGYILGLVTIVVFCLGEGLKFFLPSLGVPMSRRQYVSFLFTCAASVLTAMINPNTYHAITEFADLPQYMTKNILEYSSPYHIFLRMFQPQIPVYFFLLILAGIAGMYMLMKHRSAPVSVTDLILLAGFGYFSLNQVRYVVFFLIWAVPFLSLVLSRISYRWAVRGSLFLISAAVFVYLTTLPISLAAFQNVRNFKSGNWVNPYYPENAIRFIEDNDIRGNMYNFYDWGGYIIWRTGPERKVFIDGRGLYGYVYSQAEQIDGAVIEPKIMGKSFFKATLDSYGVTCVIVPIFSVAGKVVPLTVRMLEEKEWKPVFFFENSVLFVKDIPEYYRVLYRFAIPPGSFKEDLIKVVDRFIGAWPENTQLYVAKGDLYCSLYRLREAREAYMKALEVYPLNAIAKQRLKLLDLQKQ